MSKRDFDEPYKCSRGGIGYIGPEVFSSKYDKKNAGKYDMYSIGMIIAYAEQKPGCDVLDENEKSLNNRYADHYKFILIV